MITLVLACVVLADQPSQPEAWTTTHAILQSPDSAVEARLFAATTLKGKVRYRLHAKVLPALTCNRLRTTCISYQQKPSNLYETP